ncbi:MAG: hypothetical protein E6G60_21915 [Actinobacteria bacterium]|nr:MAG: hypothetical protein E6G60_21915 [Actinomycetota bacterium]
MTAGPPSVRAAVRLEHATIAWNTVEVFVTIGLGIAAGSLALIAFGLDSIVEIFASGVVLWNLRGEQDERRTRQSLRLVAGAFFTLAAVLLAGGVRNIVSSHHPDDSPAGIAYVAITAGVMTGLAGDRQPPAGPRGARHLPRRAAGNRHHARPRGQHCLRLVVG